MILLTPVKHFIRILALVCPLVFSVAYGVDEAKITSLQSTFLLLLSDEQAASIAATTGTKTVLIAALSKGRFTLNNLWTQGDLDYEDISATIGFQTIDGLNKWVRPYTLLIVEYQAKRRQCVEDYNLLHPPGSYTSPDKVGGKTYTFTDRKCYPKLEWVYDLDSSGIDPIDPVAAQALNRYGYYCGGGYPGGNMYTFDKHAPEPLDGVDYCCRLHDAGTWNKRGTFSNECGIAMCLRQTSVEGLAALPTDTEEARQYWYGGAASACPGNQSNDAPAPAT